MKNKDSLKFFSDMAASNPDAKAVKITKTSDFTNYDAIFILKYANANSKILDLASGSGLIVNKIFKKVKHITAVEAFSEFSKFITKSDNINIVINDITTYSTNQLFDIITMFGIVQYFDETEIIEIYKKYINNLDSNGYFIIKSQFGVNSDVTVSGYSEELKSDYFSQYRHIEKEVSLLKQIGFYNIDVIDIYPAACNRWEDTHFYAIVAKKI